MILLFISFSSLLSLLIYFSKNIRLTKVLSIFFLFALGAINFYATKYLNDWDSVFFRFDSMGLILSLVLFILSVFSFYYSFLYTQQSKETSKQTSIYYASLIMLITSMTSAYFAENMALLLVSIEATSIFVSLLVFYKRSKDSLEAAWKYLFVSSIGLVFAFIGVLFLGVVASHHEIGRLSYSDLLTIVAQADIKWMKFSFVMILVGLSVKMNIVPLFSVAIDAKTKAPSPVNALMSTALVNVGFIGIFRVFILISKTSSFSWAKNLLLLTGVLSVLMVAIQIVRVKRLKRMLAFSSMEHMGIILIGLGLGSSAFQAALMHLVFHSFIKGGLFFQVGTVKRFFKSFVLKDFGNYMSLNPLGALGILLGTISILAIPPSGLFITELMIFKRLFFTSHYLLIGILVFLLTSIIFIITRNIFNLLYQDVQTQNINDKMSSSLFENIIPIFLFSFVIYLSLSSPLFFTNLINKAVGFLN